ncbi:MAG: hypothetical protein AAGM22_21505 [Acidobacteriota bacterium]
MHRRLLTFALMSFLFVSPTLGDDETCHACSEGATCIDSTEEGFARDECRWSREVTLTPRGLVTASYVIDHPDVTHMTVESPSRGVEVYVTVDKRDAAPQFEVFQFDP